MGIVAFKDETAPSIPAPGYVYVYSRPDGKMYKLNSDGVESELGAGTVGPAGPQGPAGANGINGTNGTNGVDGAQGPMGPQGPAGTGGTGGSGLAFMATYSAVEGELIVEHLISLVPSMVDGDIVITFEDIV